jgi:recombination protein RecT
MAAAQKPEPGTAVATVPRSAVAKVLDTDAARSVILPLLANGVDFARVVQETYLAAKENPEILACTQESVVRAVAKAVSWDLVIGETVHLVPFNVKVSKKDEKPERWEKRLKAVQDYKGKIELIVRAGVARSVNAECVYEHDLFDMELGSHPFIRHRPEMDVAKRGNILGAYAAADLGQRHQPVIKWMPVGEIEQIRKQHSKQWKDGALKPWYARKTVVHQLAKVLPKNARLAEVLRAFNEDGDLGELQETPVATVGAPPTASRTLPDAPRRPRALVEGGYGDAGAAVNNAPVPPAQHADDPAGRDDDFDDEYIDDTDLDD